MCIFWSPEKCVKNSEMKYTHIKTKLEKHYTQVLSFLILFFACLFFCSVCVSCCAEQSNIYLSSNCHFSWGVSFGGVQAKSRELGKECRNSEKSHTRNK